MAFLGDYNVRTQTPCKDCKERALGCHSKCEKYAKFKESLAKLAAQKDAYRKAHPETKTYDKRFRIGDK